MKIMVRLALLACLLVLGACGGAPAEPTTQPTSVPEQSVPSATSERPTNEPTPTELSRATLPPEWTPTPSVTPLQSPVPTLDGTPMPTFDMINAVLLTSPTQEACASFQISAESQVTFPRVEGAHVYWSDVPGAAAYRVNLFSDKSDTLFTVIVGETTTHLGPTLFAVQQRYFWEVRPFDAQGNQMCPAIGSMVVPLN